MRIVHVFRSPVGGLFRCVMDLARGQAAAGHQVGIVCDATTGGERATALLADLSPALALGATRLPMARLPGAGDIATAFKVRRAAAAMRPDVIHAHGAKGGLYARLPLGPPGPAIAYTPHGGTFHYEPDRLMHRLYLAAERLLASRTDIFLFESAYIGGRVSRVVGDHAARGRVVVNGLTEAEFEPVRHAREAFDLLFVGELRLLKGIDTLFAALALLAGEGLALSLLVVGGGPDEAALKERAVQLGIARSVTFAGPRPIRSVLSEGRLMVVPSRSDSLPYVVLEAAAAAQPLIATNVGGIPEIFGEQAPRLIPRDDPQRLAAAIREMADAGPAAVTAQAMALREIVQARFSMANMRDGVLAGYREALEHRRSPQSD